MYLAGGKMPHLLGTVVFALFTLIFSLSPFVSARDLDACPLGYSSCSGIKDYAPVCCKWSGPVRFDPVKFGPGLKRERPC